MSVSKNEILLILVALVFLIAGVLIVVLVGSSDENHTRQEAQKIADHTAGTQAALMQQIVDQSVGTQVAQALPVQPISQAEVQQIIDDSSATQIALMQQIVDQSVGTQVAQALPLQPISQAEVQQIIDNSSATQVALMQQIIDNTASTPTPAAALVIPMQTADSSPTDAPTNGTTEEGDPYLGSANAPVVIVEFADFQCSYCNRFRKETLPQILNTYEGQVKIIYRDYPIFGEGSIIAAEAAQCADDQGQYWEMNNRIFNNQDANLPMELNQDTLTTFADQINISDMNAFKACLSSHKYQQEVTEDRDAAAAYGLQGTPSFIINNAVTISGAQPFDIFKQAIDAELAKNTPQGQVIIPVNTPVPSAATQTQNDITANNDPFIGVANAPVVIVEFGDFQCPYCNRFREETLPQILDRYEGQVKIIYRDYPIFGEGSVIAAEAAQCANDQGRFLPMYNRIFSNQNANMPVELNQNTLRSFAIQSGVSDMEAFKACLTSHKYRQEVLGEDSEAAAAYGLQGTPGFIIGGVVIAGAQPFEIFQQAIDAELVRNN